MTLAVVQGALAIILMMVATWTGLLVSVAFLLPRQTAKAEQLVLASPWRCFFQGIGMAMVLLMGIAASSAPNPVAKLFGLALLMFTGSLMALGSAGLVQMLGKRGEADTTTPTFAMMLRGSLSYSLAMGFPLVGWFVFAPLALTFAMGAGSMALVPEPRTIYTPPASSGGSDYDIINRSVL